jgi:hypothetical protein
MQALFLICCTVCYLYVKQWLSVQSNRRRDGGDNREIWSRGRPDEHKTGPGEELTQMNRAAALPKLAASLVGKIFSL